MNNVFYGRYTGEYPQHSRALTVVHKNQLKARNVSDVALKEDSLKRLGKITLTSRAPSLRPAGNQVSVEKLGGEKLILRKTESRYEADKGRLEGAITNKPEALRSRDIRREVIRRPESSQERKIIKRDSIGYPPSSQISVKNYPRKIETIKSSSSLSRIYRYISGHSSGSRGTSSQGSTRRISSSSHSRSAAPARTHSTSRSSGSGRVRKK
jgi:hypothetical protein